ncbi:MAG: hypothetical protein AB7P35_05635 [Hyphomonadaceae bacterium]
MGVFAMSSIIWLWSSALSAKRDIDTVVVAVVVVMPIHVVAMFTIRHLDVGMTVGEHDFPHPMAGAAFMGMRRRRRYDAKLRQSDHEQPTKESTKHDHRISLNARFLPLLEGDHREYGAAARQARRFPQYAVTQPPPYGDGSLRISSVALDRINKAPASGASPKGARAVIRVIRRACAYWSRALVVRNGGEHHDQPIALESCGRRRAYACDTSRRVRHVERGRTIGYVAG